jgi:IMP dehydrogenase/GMP reductase
MSSWSILRMGILKRCWIRIKMIKKRHPEVELIAGNIATAEAAKDLLRAGVDAVRSVWGLVQFARPVSCQGPECRS